jgi:hypothetical protein
LAETGAGAGAGAALGQQEAAKSEATAAMMASLAIFMSVFSLGVGVKTGQFIRKMGGF